MRDVHINTGPAIRSFDGRVEFQKEKKKKWIHLCVCE